MHDELRELRFFVAVARTLNFSRAAEDLFTSQPAVSRGITQLEKRVGSRLFTRTSRHVALTGAGATLLPAAEGVLRAAEAFHTRAAEIKEGTRGIVRLGIPPNVHHAALVELIAQISGRHPDIEIQPSEHPSDAQVDLVRRGELDIGLVRRPFEASGLHVHDILSEPLVVALPAHHRLARRRSVHLHDLSGERLVTYHTSSFVTAMLKTCREHGFVPSEVRQAAELSTQLALIASGTCVSLVPRRTSDVTPGIAVRPIVGEPVLMHTAAVWPRGKGGNAALVAAVIDSVLADPTRAI